MPDLIAFVDESFREHERDGFYVLAAAIFDVGAENARQAMLALRGRRRTDKLHWNEMDERDRHEAATTVFRLGGLHLVTIGAPVPRTRQERARRISLRQLVFELHGIGVTELRMEARQDVLDQRDVQLVRNARYDLPKGTRLHVQHQRGRPNRCSGWRTSSPAPCVRGSRGSRSTRTFSPRGSASSRSSADGTHLIHA